MRRVVLLACVAAAGVLALPAGAASATTFDGQCVLNSHVSWDPPLKVLPQEIAWEVESERGASCVGTLDGEPYSGEVDVEAGGVGTFACDLANAPGGTGTVKFANGKKLDFNIDVVGVLRIVPMFFEGAEGGHAIGETQFWTTYYLTGITGCLPEASGVPSAHFDAFVATEPGGMSG